MKNPLPMNELMNCDGNAFAILARFRRDAREHDWSRDDIDEVLTEARAGDYDHLLAVISSHYQ